MAVKVGINGFGRIGRPALRAMLERHQEDLAVVAINDMADLATNVHLFRYDSTYGIYPRTIEAGAATLNIDGREPPARTLFRPARGRQRRSAWSCRSLRASSTGCRCACPPRPCRLSIWSSI